VFPGSSSDCWVPWSRPCSWRRSKSRSKRMWPLPISFLESCISRTQTETLAIRGLSVGMGIRRNVRREALTGLSVGALLGAVMLPVVSLMTGDTMLAFAVAVAVLAASAIATVVAMVLHVVAITLQGSRKRRRPSRPARTTPE